MRSHHIATASPAVSGPLDGSRGRLVWWAWRETTGAAAAVFRLWDGSSNQGRLLLPISLAAGESTRDFVGQWYLPYETGLFLEVLSGSIEGSVLVMSWDQTEPWGIPVVIVGNVTVDVNAGT